MITGEQVKAVRKLLGWSQMTLGNYVGVSRSAISKLERGRGISDRTVRGIREAFEAAGVAANGGEPGVKLKAKK
jgi:transcriptional regulator with XRE-family HTH domain